MPPIVGTLPVAVPQCLPQLTVLPRPCCCIRDCLFSVQCTATFYGEPTSGLYLLLLCTRAYDTISQGTRGARAVLTSDPGASWTRDRGGV